MRLLVAIAHYGTKNRRFMERLVREYRSMSHSVDVIALSEADKEVPGADVRVGLPSEDPWSLPFAHRAIFDEHRGEYDVYIYSEDDTLIQQRHVDAFVEVARLLPPGYVPGFMRYETHPDGSRSYCTVHSHYHWCVDSGFTCEGESFASFTNMHSACYMLTAEQLEHCISSGGFLIPPHKGVYDMLVSAATDPYTQCGLEKVICISRIHDFVLHHLPNVYLGKMGIDEQDFTSQVAAMAAAAGGSADAGYLFPVETALDVPEGAWNKSYYPRPESAVLEFVGDEPRSILSVGVGSGDAELPWVEQGREVWGIPLDAVISTLARARGIRLTSPDFALALRELDGRRFDAIVLHDVIAHLPDPARVLRELRGLVAPNGFLVTLDPNGTARRLNARRRGRALPNIRGRPFDEVLYRDTGAKIIRETLAAAGWKAERCTHVLGERAARFQRLSLGLLGSFVGRRVVTLARPLPNGAREAESNHA